MLHLHTMSTLGYRSSFHLLHVNPLIVLFAIFLDDNKDLSSTSSENENAKLMNFEGQGVNTLPLLFL